MRLHWVTEVVLMATFARLAADLIQSANGLGVYMNLPDAGAAGPEGYLTVADHFFSSLSQTAIYFGSAAVVETLHRILKGLQRGAAHAEARS